MLKTEYERRISVWSSDVCSSDLRLAGHRVEHDGRVFPVGGFDILEIDLFKRLLPAGSLFGFGGIGAEPADEFLELLYLIFHLLVLVGKIGRASCRECVCQYV